MDIILRVYNIHAKMLTRRDVLPVGPALPSFPYWPTGNEFCSASPNLIGLDTLRSDWLS